MDRATARKDSRIRESYPLQLQYIKAFFLQKQYRQCITACRDVVKLNDPRFSVNPLHCTFVQFYLAIAHDELARAMHNFSQAKVPAFEDAEQFYHKALLALPTPDECREAMADFAPESIHDKFYDSTSTSRDTSSNSLSTIGARQIQSNMHSPPMSPPTHIRNSSLPTQSPPVISPGTTTSDDLESHESFNDIMTANRLPKLERDYSSMSLLQPPQQQIGQSLMRPIRLGSPAKPYYLPPRLPYTKNVEQQRSRLPKLNTTTSNGSPVSKQLRTPTEQWSPIDSPVSPLGSEAAYAMSDTSTISPITPETPFAGAHYDAHIPDSSHQLRLHAVTEHVECVRVQLESHIKLLDEAKQRILATQADRAAKGPAPNKRGTLAALIDAANENNKRMPQTRSYWSFTPEDVKLLERKKWIEIGRDRGWTKERFEPARYAALADAALAEI